MVLATLRWVALAVAAVGAGWGAALPAAGPRTGPVTIVDVTVGGRGGVDALTEAGYDVAHVRGNVATVYASDAELRALKAAGFALAVVGLRPAAGAAPGKAPDGYRPYDDLTAALAGYAEDYPDLCRLTSLGPSVQGRELWAMLITDAPDVEEDEPEFKYVSTMHGDEPVGTELCLYFIDRLLTDYGADPRIRDLVDTTAIWVVPLMNPDGYEAGTRRNANGYDLNRSFPAYPDDFEGTVFDAEALDLAGYPLEVVHVANWTMAHSFVLSANLHTGALVVNYPYDDDGLPSGYDAPTPDDLMFEDVARRYSVHNPPMWDSGYFDDGITNGSAWYVIDGGMQDWHYRYVSCNEVTIELSDTKAPPASALPALWADNEGSMLAFAEAVHIGVRGLVADAATGEPLWAEVRVEGNDHPVFTDPDVGDYHRMLLPGTYTLRYAAPGYVPWTAADAVVGPGAATRIDVSLRPADLADVNFDGRVSAVDVQLVVNAILGLPVPYDCDLDGGGVTSTDLQIVVNTALGRV